MEFLPELPKDKITFTLKDGSSITLDKADYDTIIEKIKMEVVVRTVVDHPERVFIEADVNGQKIANLYKILQEQKNMKEELREEYLRTILELSKGQTGFKSFKKTLDEKK